MSMLKWRRMSVWRVRWWSTTAPRSGMEPFSGETLIRLPLDFPPMYRSDVSFTPLDLPPQAYLQKHLLKGLCAYSLLRSCTIEPECIIGQNSILTQGSLVESNSILEAGSVVPPGRRITIGELWAGNPAKFVRTLTHEETVEIPKLAVAINDLSRSHFSEFLPFPPCTWKLRR